MSSSPPPCVADFDSATGMLRALAHYLHGQDFPLLGTMPRWTAPGMRLIATLINRLPRQIQEQIYIWSGWYEAIAPEQLGTVNAEQVAAWMVSLYPQRQYPAVMVGASNGAAVHLCAALGIPWLPQTFLIPVARSGIQPDEPQKDAKWAEQPARVLLERNPDIQLHHMHDPNQDRLMIQRMTYFRVKRLRLGAAYERFLQQTLAPGGTIFLLECGLHWPTTQYGDRHFFQFGALGGATAEEYLHGSERVEEYLARYRSPHKRWQPPPPDGEQPEAEWGFAPELKADVDRFAQQHGYTVRRISFTEPEHFSPLAADLYRWWLHQRGIMDSRLLVESFIVMEPYWAIGTGSVPFWMVFNTEPSAAALAAYLEQANSFDEIFLMLFSHGVNSVGLTPIAQWWQLLGRARKHGTFVGVDERVYPRDFAVFVRYYFDLLQKIPSRYPLPPALTLTQLAEFLAQHQGCYHVQWQADSIG